MPAEPHVTSHLTNYFERLINVAQEPTVSLGANAKTNIAYIFIVYAARPLQCLTTETGKVGFNLPGIVMSIEYACCPSRAVNIIYILVL